MSLPPNGPTPTWIAAPILGSPPIRRMLTRDGDLYLVADVQWWTRHPTAALDVLIGGCAVDVDGYPCVPLSGVIAMLASAPNPAARESVTMPLKRVIDAAQDEAGTLPLATWSPSPYRGAEATRAYTGENHPALLLEWALSAGRAAPKRLLVITEPSHANERPHTPAEAVQLARLILKEIRQPSGRGLHVGGWQSKARLAAATWLFELPSPVAPRAEGKHCAGTLRLSLLTPVNGRWVATPLAWAKGWREDEDAPVAFEVQGTRAPNDSAPPLSGVAWARRGGKARARQVSDA